MNTLRLKLLFVLFIFHMVLYAQNHIENPSFENVSGCPDDFFQIYKAPPWFSPNCEPLRPDRHGYAILFTSQNSCTSDITGVPKNVVCYQPAHSGVSYAGIEVVSAKTLGSAYRQYLETKLQVPLEAGKRYLFSMFYSLCYADPVSSNAICFKTDSLGAFFSEDMIDKNRNCDQLPVAPQVNGDKNQVSPSSVWIELSGCITAKGNEQYVTIGNFAGDPFSNCSAVDSSGHILFIDDVSLIHEITKQFDTVICKVNEWKINAQQLRPEYGSLGGWKYQWSDGSEEIERKFTVAGNYTLNVTNKNCFTDVYNFKIEFIDCDCKDYIPGAFTPNGDNLNDNFIPHIICQNQQISGYEFSIFNRWGKRIFFTNSDTQAWDGTYKGKAVPAGEYLYLVEYKSGLLQEAKIIKGMVLVLQ